MFEVHVDRPQWDRVARACQDEADGRELRRDLSRNLHAVLQPALGEVRSMLMSAPNGALTHAGIPLLPAISRELDVDVILNDRSGGAFIVAGNASMPRNFKHAPKRLQGRRGWRHPTFGRQPVVTQMGQPEWFDGPLRARHGRLRAAAVQAVDGMARRIARKG